MLTDFFHSFSLITIEKLYRVEKLICAVKLTEGSFAGPAHDARLASHLRCTLL